MLRDKRVFRQQEETLSLLQCRHFLPCNKPNVKYYIITPSTPPAALQVPPNTSLQREGSFLTKRQQEITMSWAHWLTSTGLLSFSLLWEAHVAPSGAWGERQRGLCQVCPVSPAPAPGPSAVIASHRTTGKSCSKLCKHRGYYASSVLVTVSSSLITVVMIGLWPVNSFKETSHYRRGRQILLWV